MHNTPAPGGDQPGPAPGDAPAAPGDPKATRLTTIVLSASLALVVLMTGALAAVAVLMTRNPDAPPLTTTPVKRLQTPIFLAPVTGVTAAPCQADLVPDQAGAKCYQLDPGETVSTVQDIEEQPAGAGKFALRVVLSPGDRAKIGALTRDTVRQQLAIVVDDKVVAAPLVEQEITEDSLSIAGFSRFEADALLAALLGGVAPAVPQTTSPSPAFSQQSTPAATPGAAIQSPAVESSSAVQSSPAVQSRGAGGVQTRYRDCADAVRHGVGPYFRDIHPQYAWYMDKNHNGVACDQGDL
jgi:hypothetical protein